MDRLERVTAYVDGELGEAERAAFERELAADAELQRDVAQQEKLRFRLAEAYDPVLTEVVPFRLAAAAQAANDPRRVPRAAQWIAMAACLVVGVMIGRVAMPEGGPLVTEHGALIARGDLARALDDRLAADDGPVRVGISFRSKDGHWCRTFQSTPDRLAGLACRDADGWQAKALAAWSPNTQPDYRTAGSETPPAVLATVDELMAGPPLDAAGERQARDSHWRR
jgi:hypothetical protein